MPADEISGGGSPQVHYSNTREEIVSAYAELVASSAVMQSQRRGGESMLICVIALTIFFAWYYDDPIQPRLHLVGWIGLGVAMSVAAVVLVRFTFRRRIAAGYRKWADSGVFDAQIGGHDLTLAEEGLVDRHEQGMFFTKWEYIDSVVSTPEYIKVMINPAAMCLIPKAAFADPAAAEAFEDTAKRRLAEARKTTPPA